MDVRSKSLCYSFFSSYWLKSIYYHVSYKTYIILLVIFFCYIQFQLHYPSFLLESRRFYCSILKQDHLGHVVFLIYFLCKVICLFSSLPLQWILHFLKLCSPLLASWCFESLKKKKNKNFNFFWKLLCILTSDLCFSFSKWTINECVLKCHPFSFLLCILFWHRVFGRFCLL